MGTATPLTPAAIMQRSNIVKMVSNATKIWQSEQNAVSVIQTILSKKPLILLKIAPNELKTVPALKSAVVMLHSISWKGCETPHKIVQSYELNAKRKNSVMLVSFIRNYFQETQLSARSRNDLF